MTEDMDTNESSTIIVRIKKKLSFLKKIEFQPVGKWFQIYEKNKSLKSLKGVENGTDNSSRKTVGLKIEDDIEYLKSLDPADCKSQDNYKVLGLQKYRYRASLEDVKQAHRTMVLRYHPDKRKHSEGQDKSNTIIPVTDKELDCRFTCITRAYEALCTKEKKRAYDSVDSTFDDTIPTSGNAKKNGFFETFGPVFQMNARFSSRRPVPTLGGVNDLRPKVDAFYRFWGDFSSWREFSYLDEEDKDKGQCRDERKYIDRINKGERERRRREEVVRIDKLVARCKNNDPRIVKWFHEDREEMVQQQREKEEAAKRAAQEAQEKARRDAAMVKQKLKEAEERAEAKRQQKEARGPMSRAQGDQDKDCLRSFVLKRDYFGEQKLKVMMDVEYLCQHLKAAQVRDFTEQLCQQNEEDVKNVFLGKIDQIKEKKEKDKQAALEEALRIASQGGGLLSHSSSKSKNESSSAKEWSPEDMQLLIKATNLVSSGTSKRWDVVTEYVNQRSSTDGSRRTAKEVMAKVKELQTSGTANKVKANFQPSDKTTKMMNVPEQNNPSIRMETPQEMLGMNLCTWSSEEQRLLEQALKTYPASTAERWDKIAECVPNRSKRDCMNRFKELAEMVRAKKAAMAADKK